MPDPRPRLKFDENSVCTACIHYEKQKSTDWDKRWKELEEIGKPNWYIDALIMPFL